VLNAPVDSIDPFGLSTKRGSLTMNCKKGPVRWPVYGDSKRARVILGGREGCVTLLVPKGVFWTASCQAVKGWVSPGSPNARILNHEACHACAHEDPWDCCFLTWIPGGLTGHCHRHPIHPRPGW